MGGDGLRRRSLFSVLLSCSLVGCSSLAEPTINPVGTGPAPDAPARTTKLVPPAPDATLPNGFAERIVLEDLVQPTAIAFSPDGRVFVGEKSGRIVVFDGLGDETLQVVADLSREVYNFYELGLLDIALAPAFPQDPYLYVAYTRDAPVDGEAPTWGDECPGGPGPDSPGCGISGRISRIELAGDVMAGTEQVLITDWCGQFESHSVGAMVFGPDGALFASGGEGASPHFPDYGQLGDPPNVCGDPENEGGALRSQDLLTTSDPQGLSGSIIRIDPVTGESLPDNPMSSSEDPNTQRIIAYGLRNPFRMAFDPEIGDLWIGDVGWANWDELNRLALDDQVLNFGWPCFEGGVALRRESAPYSAVLDGLEPSAAWSFEPNEPMLELGANVRPDQPLVGDGMALAFDGGEDGSATLDLPPTDDEFTFAIWFEAETWDDNPQLIAGGDAWEVAFDETVFFRVRISGEDHFASVPTAPATRTTHLLVATYSGARQRLYLDGQVVADNVLTGPFAMGDSIRIGPRFRGSIDEPALFDRELTGAEVSAVWAAGGGGRAAVGRQPRYAPIGLELCDELYADPAAVTPPHSAYEIGSEVAPADGCPTGASALSGLAFGSDASFPAPYAEALFFADFTRSCIWLLARNPDGSLATEPVLFMREAAGPVDLVTTPHGTLVYVDFVGGSVREIYSVE